MSNALQSARLRRVQNNIAGVQHAIVGDAPATSDSFGEVSQQIAGINSSLSTLNTRTTVLEGGQASNTSNVNASLLNNTLLSTRVTTAESNIVTAQNDISTNESDISSLQTDVTSHNTRISSVESQLSNNVNAVGQSALPVQYESLVSETELGYVFNRGARSEIHSIRSFNGRAGGFTVNIFDRPSGNRLIHGAFLKGSQDMLGFLYSSTGTFAPPAVNGSPVQLESDNVGAGDHCLVTPSGTGYQWFCQLSSLGTSSQAAYSTTGTPGFTGAVDSNHTLYTVGDMHSSGAVTWRTQYIYCCAYIRSGTVFLATAATNVFTDASMGVSAEWVSAANIDDGNFILASYDGSTQNMFYQNYEPSERMLLPAVTQGTYTTFVSNVVAYTDLVYDGSKAVQVVARNVSTTGDPKVQWWRVEFDFSQGINMSYTYTVLSTIKASTVYDIREVKVVNMFGTQVSYNDLTLFGHLNIRREIDYNSSLSSNVVHTASDLHISRGSAVTSIEENGIATNRLLIKDVMNVSADDTTMSYLRLGTAQTIKVRYNNSWTGIKGRDRVRLTVTNPISWAYYDDHHTVFNSFGYDSTNEIYPCIETNGDIVLNAGVLRLVSDSRIKKNVKDHPASTALSNMHKIKIKEYGYHHPSRRPAYGILAQDLIEDLPHSVAVTPGIYYVGESDRTPETSVEDKEGRYIGSVMEDGLSVNKEQIWFTCARAVQWLIEKFSFVSKQDWDFATFDGSMREASAGDFPILAKSTDGFQRNISLHVKVNCPEGKGFKGDYIKYIGDALFEIQQSPNNMTCGRLLANIPTEDIVTLTTLKGKHYEAEVLVELS